MPALNPQRRDALTDAAIAVLASGGTHGLSHRAVDERAGVPAGTTSNYFRSRDALLVATAERIMHLHFAWLDQMRGKTRDKTRDKQDLVKVVDEAIRRHRERYLAMFHLALESTYRPELQDSVGRVIGLTHQLVEAPPDDAALLHISCIGLLFSALVVPDTIGGRRPADLARAMLTKVLPDDPGTPNGGC